MKKVGILTPFGQWDTAYSLVSVVNDQLIAHLKNGYEPVLFVLESFKDEKKVPKGVKVRKVVPQLYLEAYKGLEVPENYKDEVKKVSEVFKKHMSDLDVLITHDIIFVDTYLPYNLGLREANIKAKQLHFIHSAPSPRPQIEGPHANRYSVPPNSKLVYLNNEQVIPLAEMYGIWPNDVRVVKNSVDPRTFWGLDPLVEKIVDEYGVLTKDIVTVYPVSTTRMVDGKQIDTVIRIHEGLRKLGYSTMLIVPNAHANAEKEIEACKLRANDHVVFTSLLGKEYQHGVPRKVVSDLFRLSDLFIFPSISENCSLILLEAMLSGNLCVLNSDCPGFTDIVGYERALWFKFGSLRMGTRIHEHAVEREQYTQDVARIIAAELEKNKIFLARRHAMREYNYQTMFRNLERLYHESD